MPKLLDIPNRQWDVFPSNHTHVYNVKQNSDFILEYLHDSFWDIE